MKNSKLKNKLVSYLENDVHFRDYEIRHVSDFGKYNKIAVHQIVESDSLESDVSDAIESFSKDGFPEVVFYIDALRSMEGKVKNG